MSSSPVTTVPQDPSQIQVSFADFHVREMVDGVQGCVCGERENVVDSLVVVKHL